MAFNQTSLPLGQVLSAATVTIAGATVLPRTGSPITLVSVLVTVSIVAGVIVLTSFVVTRILKHIK
jgi:hypothetical protein